MQAIDDGSCVASSSDAAATTSASSGHTIAFGAGGAAYVAYALPSPAGRWVDSAVLCGEGDAACASDPLLSDRHVAVLPPGAHVEDDALKEFVGHDADAPNVVILSVVVDPAFQGQGLSRVLMEEFVARMKAMNKATIYLMCPDYNVPLYEKFGYRYLNPSASNLGGRAWHEMSMVL